MIRYTLHEAPKGAPRWQSPEAFEARDAREVEQAVRAGWLAGTSRWAEDEDGFRLFGLGADGTVLRSPAPMVLATRRTKGTRLSSW